MGTGPNSTLSRTVLWLKRLQFAWLFVAFRGKLVGYLSSSTKSRNDSCAWYPVNICVSSQVRVKKEIKQRDVEKSLYAYKRITSKPQDFV